MQSLLRWGIENSANDDSTSGVAPLTQRTDLDPGIIDAILGRPDSELMKDALAKAQDASLDEDARLTALDDLEMLVENIDNANDLEKLGMWEPLQGLLASPSDDVKTQALWVIGTAVQNNPTAQKAYLALGPFPAVLSYLTPSSRAPKQLRSKTVYVLSGLLKHNAAALAPFEAAGGWEALRGALSDSDISVRRKTAFLLNSLLMPSAAAAVTPAASTSGAPIREGGPSTAAAAAAGGEEGAGEIVHPNSHASMVADPASVETAPATLRALRTHGLLAELVRELTTPTPCGADGDEYENSDADLTEKLMTLLHTYVSVHRGTFDGPEKDSLRTFLGARRVAQSEGELEFGADELQALESAIA